MGNIQFNNSKILFVGTKIAFHSDCCCGSPGLECNGCNLNTTRNEMRVTISGLSDSEPGCNPGECASFNGEYIVEQVESPPFCIWRLVYDEGDCGDFEVELQISSVVILVFLNFTSNRDISWRKFISGPIDCSDVDETLTFLLQTVGLCNVDTTTVRVESI